MELIRSTLAPHGVALHASPDPEAAWQLLRREHPDIVIADAALARRARLLERILDWDPGVQVLLLVEPGDEEAPLEGIRLGAQDCIAKPLSQAALSERLQVFLDETRLRRQTLELDEKLLESFRFHGMVGRSPEMLEVFARIRRVAPHYRVALITGATGTGKELVAQALHALSPVANRRFVVCNCSAIVETLFESELFGHVKGAFTGAAQDRVGLFEYAQGGTVFLDEISDIPLTTQSKLLRVVQNQELQRVGSSEVRKVDVRLVAATNRDMHTMIAEKIFREDLYYRLSMIELKLPKLADRKEDLPLLERHFIERFAGAYGRNIGGISRRAQSLLARHNWPGNVRELENVLGHACMLAEMDFIDLRDLPEYLRNGTRAPSSDGALLSLEEVDRRYTRYVIDRMGGNKLRAAQVLGISRATLYRLLREGEAGSSQPVLDALEQPAAPRIRLQ